MRNWNKKCLSNGLKQTSMHLPYLWGIEILTGSFGRRHSDISIYRTYEELKSANGHRSGSIIIWHLPYLWGIEIEKYDWASKADYGIYRTYEELKFYLEADKVKTVFSIYRTYEELKSCWDCKTPAATCRIYRTYEELKSGSGVGEDSVTVTHLPYLWGIEIKQIFKALLPYPRAFTVPMRNWNRHEEILHGGRQLAFTVPMRNWNSTSILASAISFSSIYRTYEELKFYQYSGFRYQLFKHLPYLWGIEIRFPPSWHSGQ